MRHKAVRRFRASLRNLGYICMMVDLAVVVAVVCVCEGGQSDWHWYWHGNFGDDDCPGPMPMPAPPGRGAAIIGHVLCVLAFCFCHGAMGHFLQAASKQWEWEGEGSGSSVEPLALRTGSDMCPHSLIANSLFLVRVVASAVSLHEITLDASRITPSALLWLPLFDRR